MEAGYEKATLQYSFELLVAGLTKLELVVPYVALSI
jgi:hypothetical protein